jgi:hypothetical protein
MRAFVALSALALIGATPPPDEPPPGEGVICMLALVHAAAEVGSRCFPGQNPTFQAELETEAGRIDEYVLKNAPMKPGDLAKFRREQALAGVPTAKVCGPDPISIYKGFLAVGADQLKSNVDRLLARPGKPTWGDCL